jgi:uncharacterized protein YndB with AHSA1/START domain
MATVQDVAAAAVVGAAANEPIRLEVTRMIKAPRARVFDAWTRPEMIRLWFGPEGMKPAEVSTDPQVGGAYSIALESCAPGSEAGGEPKHSIATGRYTKVNPYDLLQFTWTGNWVPGEESLVTVHFRELDGGTEIKLIHDRFHTEQSRDGHNAGWIRCMDRLAEKLAEKLAE